MADSSAAATLLPQTIVLLGAAVVSVPLFNALRLGSVVGYLVAGVLVGPQVLRLVSDPALILSTSELGIVMFLFLVGLEMEPKRVWRMRRDIFALGGAQVVVTGLACALMPLAFGRDWQASLIAGLGLALSSTAIMGQVLEEAGERHTTQGERAFAVAIFQDIAIVPLLALVAALSPWAGAQGQFSWVALARAGLAIAIIVGAGLYLLNPMFRALALWGRREIMTAAALLVIAVAALLMEHAGLSMATGAFLAGMFLAESHFRHQLEAEIEPFRGLLMGLFFLSIGMTLDLGVVALNWPRVLAGVAGLVIIKFVVMYGLMRLFGHRHDEAVRVSLLLDQAGEFGFVLFAAAVGAGVMTAGHSSVLIAVIVISMALSPFLYRLAPRLGRPVAAADIEPPANFDGVRGEVLIVGFGRFGQLATQLLNAKGVAVTIIDNDIEMIEAAGRFGSKVYYGDGTRLDVLRAAGVERARMVSICVDKAETANRVVDLVREAAPDAAIYARAYDRRHAIELEARNVDFAIRETMMSALAFGRQQLIGLGVDAQTAQDVHDDVMRRDAERLAIQAREGMRAGGHLVSGNMPRPEPLIPPAKTAKTPKAEPDAAAEGQGPPPPKEFVEP